MGCKGVYCKGKVGKNAVPESLLLVLIGQIPTHYPTANPGKERLEGTSTRKKGKKRIKSMLFILGIVSNISRL